MSAIRIHARAMGHPVCGDPVYTQAEALGTVPTLAPTDPPLCLHAWRITLTHPITRKRVTYEAPPPAWAGDGENLPCIRQEKDLEIPAGQHCVCA